MKELIGAMRQACRDAGIAWWATVLKRQVQPNPACEARPRTKVQVFSSKLFELPQQVARRLV